jgi:hypothetical protein
MQKGLSARRERVRCELNYLQFLVFVEQSKRSEVIEGVRRRGKEEREREREREALE